MKRIIFLPLVFSYITIFLSFEKEKTVNINKSALINELSQKFRTSMVTLTVECLSSRTQPLGGSFQHKVKLMNGTSSIANVDVKINDPIGRICTWVTTDSKGEAIWNRSIPLDTKQQCYAIEFFYGNVKYYSNVAVMLPLNAITLPSYSINLNSAKSLDNRNLVIASRGGFTSTQQSINTTLKEAVQLGKAVAVDYLSNPANILTTTVAAVSCTAGELIPAAGQAICVTSSTMVRSGLASSTVKILGNRLIDATNFSEADKTNIKNKFDLSTIAYSVTTLNPAEGLSKLDALGAGYDFVKNSYSQLIYVNGVLKGASISAQKVGSSDVYMMSIYDRGTSNNIATSNQTTIQQSKDPKCNENYTGDYCFQNNTSLDLNVTFWSNASKLTNRISMLTCTLQPDQKQCFFTVPEGAARYEIKTPATYSVNYYGVKSTPQKTYSANGTVYVNRCQENTLFINLETPSYSSNIPTQTNGQNIQQSKDPNCNVNYTGDYCFQNNTSLDLNVTFWSNAGKLTNRISMLTCTLQPGQKQCFFTLPEGAARYEIKTPATYSVNYYGVKSTPQKTYSANGAVYVNQCEENTLFINLETPSYSSNVPAQTYNIQKSKDSKCNENYTGDYCFQNNTGLDLNVTFWSNASKLTNRITMLTCTLQPGQKQCFFTVPGGAARYEIKTPATYSVNYYGVKSTLQKTYSAKGSVYVEPCQENTFIIK